MSEVTYELFRSETVFVLGAGASAEVDLPIGSTLLKEIYEIINIRYDMGRMNNGDYLASEALKLVVDEGREVAKYNEHLHAAWQIGASAQQALSIDNLVDALEDENVERIAKIGIARAIHLAEGRSKYFQPKEKHVNDLVYSRFSDTWYDRLTKLVCEGRRKSDLGNVFQNLSFVSFNYDRCIENYLPRSVANYFGVPVSEVLPAFNKVKIHRPYGIAGDFSWGHRGEVQEFGGSNAAYLSEASKRIRTFTEGVENPETLADMKSTISKAEKIVFLGSAFHRQNLDLIASPIKGKILATASGVSESDLSVVRDELGVAFKVSLLARKDRIEFAKMRCCEFFDSYWRTLTS